MGQSTEEVVRSERREAGYSNHCGWIQRDSQSSSSRVELTDVYSPIMVSDTGSVYLCTWDALIGMMQEYTSELG